jgi:hypothetical protein
MLEGLGRSERLRALLCYLTGLLLDGERKSIEPMASRLVEDEAQADAMRQPLQQCVSASKWSDSEVRRRLALKLEEKLPGLEALVVDDTGLPKKGRHSVGVTRQYSGTLGRTDNCQVAVSLHMEGERGSGCVGMRLSTCPKSGRRPGAGCVRPVSRGKSTSSASGSLRSSFSTRPSAGACGKSSSWQTRPMAAAVSFARR